MKKLLSLLLCITLCLICSSCGVDNDNSQNDSNSDAISTTLLIDQENVKISFCGISPDIGVGEGIDDLQPFDAEAFADGLFGE